MLLRLADSLPIAATLSRRWTSWSLDWVMIHRHGPSPRCWLRLYTRSSKFPRHERAVDGPALVPIEPEPALTKERKILAAIQSRPGQVADEYREGFGSIPAMT